MVMNVGRICTKLSGREAGETCVVIDVVDKSYVMISGPSVRRRKCNIKHLEPHERAIEIKKGASDEEVLELLKKEGLA
ncbi:MAG: 50S ribosomal protein L14e [Theionarchaea archaeon]|nr:50S ribosomal protein L14e [Theionarchaea archaeon]